MIREGKEDIMRTARDTVHNQKMVQKWDIESNQYLYCKWEELKVGQVIRIHEDEEVPADLVLLASSDSQATCIVDTMNIDGATHFTTKHVPHDLQPLFSQLDTLEVDEH